jgi:hypothetical protein
VNLFEMPWRLSAQGYRAAAAIVVDYLTKRLPGGDVGPTSATRIVALIFRFKDFEIDVARQELRRTGTIVHIEPQVFDLLVHLIRNRDRIVSRDELIDAVWQGRIVSDATTQLPHQLGTARARRQRQRPEPDSHSAQTGVSFRRRRRGRQLPNGCHCDREWGSAAASGPRCREARAGGRTAAAPRRSFD